jgi:hypothetical protein
MIRVPGLWLIKHKEIDAHIVCFRELLFHCASFAVLPRRERFIPGALGDACLRDQRYQHNRRLLQRHRQRRARLHLQERPVGIAAVPKCDTIHRAIWDQQLQRDRGTRAGTRLHVQRWYVQRNRGTGLSRDSSQGHRSRWTDRRHGGPDSWFLGVLPLTNLSDQNHRFVVLL